MPKCGGMDLALPRKMLRTLEPYHGMIYFVPEANDAYERIGLRGRRMGYFASRSAAMGAVSADVVIATFFNFSPDVVRRAIPAAWQQAAPTEVVDARLGAADAALRRMLGDAITSDAMREAADLSRAATAGCFREGHPLYASHAAQPWPDDPHLVLWHAQTLLREFRGDGHVAALVAQGLTGCEALVVHEATGDIAAGLLQASRAWPDADWAAAVDRVRKRGWLADDGSLTMDGRAARAWVEDRTDELALVCWQQLGEAQCSRLRELVRPFSRTIVDQSLAFARPWDEN
jgi:helix-turn-helix protein